MSIYIKIYIASVILAIVPICIEAAREIRGRKYLTVGDIFIYLAVLLIPVINILVVIGFLIDEFPEFCSRVVNYKLIKR